MTDAKLCFIDRDGRYQVIHGAADDARTLMTLVDDASCMGRSHATRVSQQLVRVIIQAKRGLSPADRVLGLFYGKGRCSRSRVVKLKVIQGGLA